MHARFERVGDAWAVVDDGLSRNGTFVNGERRERQAAPERRRHAALRRNPGDLPLARPRRTRRGRARGRGLSTTQRRVLGALCRPFKGGSGFAAPADDEQIAEDLFLSVREVRAHLKVLYAKLGIQEGEGARLRLVERAFSEGLVSERDL